MMVLVLGGATIVMFFMIGYNLFIYDQKRKKRQPLQQTDDNVWPNLFDPQWMKIGKVSRLMIYPVKSSIEAVRYNSCAFYDYGMRYLDDSEDFFDGTKDKFEDARRYPLLQRMRANLTGFTEATLSNEGMNNSTVKVNISRNRYPYRFLIERIWNGTVQVYYGKNEEVNTWVKEMIGATQVNKTDDDIILTQMIPIKGNTAQKLKDNWFRFVQGYKTMEENETGELITLPRFVLMTSQTHQKLKTRNDANMAPNIIINTDKLMHPFEERNWNWIKIGNNVILRKVKPIPRGHLSEEYQHRGIYCGLFTVGIARENDDVFIYPSN